MGALKKTATVLEMIKIQHAVFALPWAFVAAMYAVGDNPVPWADFGWILLAMVAARSAAMAFNRYADATLDAENPRTAQRAIPRGLVSPAFTLAFAVVMAGLLVLAAAMLNPLCLKLSLFLIPVNPGSGRVNFLRFGDAGDMFKVDAQVDAEQL